MTGFAERMLHGLMTVLALGVAAYAIVAYGLLEFGTLVHPDMRQVFAARPVGIGLHVFASAFALALGPFQFLPGLRARRPGLHRQLGRVYLTAVAVGGLSGLYMARFAFGGGLAQSGFTVLALLWLGSSALALRAILGGDVAAHRRWMLRSFALTFAAVTLRLQLGLGGLAGLAFEQYYPVVAWSCWVPNLLLLEWWLRRGSRPWLPTPGAT